MFEKLSNTGHESIIYHHDKSTGLKAIVGIHDTTLGPALGGVRIWDYNNEGRLEHYFLSTKFSGKLCLGSPEKERMSEDNIYKLEWIEFEKLNEINLYPEWVKNKIVIKLL